MSLDAPLTPAGNGRTDDGKFAPGNKIGAGNPNNKRAAQLRNILLAQVTDADFVEVLNALVIQAKAGEMPAIKELLDRLLGNSMASVELSGADGEPLGISLATLQLVILDALSSHPEARVSVAAKLRSLSTSD